MGYEKRRLNGSTRPRPGVYSDKTLPRNVSERIVLDAPRDSDPQGTVPEAREIFTTVNPYDKYSFPGNILGGPDRERRCSTRSPASGARLAAGGGAVQMPLSAVYAWFSIILVYSPPRQLAVLLRSLAVGSTLSYKVFSVPGGA
jgi:hypothetical protein